jgi:tRNA dimethylallyltransferase
VVGGSGLYIRALLENWQVPAIPPDPAFRISCEIEAERSGVDALYERLFAVDPGEAARIGPHNLRRIIRALEMYRATDVAPSQLKTRGQSPYTYLIIGLTSDRDTLYSRINNRVEMMLKSGLVDEVKGIIDLGYDLRQSAFSSIGYREIGRYLKGEIDLSSAVELIKISTHRFARRQYTWFRPLADALVWLDCATDPYPIAAEKIRPFLQDATN